MISGGLLQFVQQSDEELKLLKKRLEERQRIEEIQKKIEEKRKQKYD